MKLTGKYSWTFGFSIALVAASSAYAQTAVTTPGGSTSTVPVFTGGSTLGNSSISVDPSTGNVGIQGSSNPSLSVGGDVNFNGVLRYQNNPLIVNYFGANLGVGINALPTAPSGLYNTALGGNALYSDTLGDNNVALGFEALKSNTEGSSNMAIGSYSLILNTTGNSNSGIGTGALDNNTTGSNNTGIGGGALTSNLTGSDNSGVGISSLNSLQTGTSNTAVGANSLTGIVSGVDNVALGDGAGDDYAPNGVNSNGPISSANQNTYVGSSTQSKNDGDSNETVIGAYAVGNGSNTVTLGNTSVTATVLRGTVTMPNMLLTGSGITFSDGSALTTANGLGSSGGGGSTSIVTLGTVTTGSWNASPIAPSFLPSDVDYADQPQTFTGQKSFMTNVGIGTTSPTAPLTVVSSNNGGNVILGAFLDPSLPNGGLSQIQFGQSQATNADGTLVYTYNSSTPGLSYASLGTYGNSFTLNVTGNGNVGIGTTTPGSALEVNGPVQLTRNSGASLTFQDGSVQSVAWNGTTLGGDYAEAVDVLGDRTAYEPGDVIVIDDSTDGKFAKSDKAYSRMVAGVYSTKPGLVGRRTTTDRPDKDAEVPMAMMGIVPTKVSTENGPIQRGDLLVSSSTPGYAMKGTDRDRLTGAIVGKALAPLATGTGVIEVLISLQ